MAVYKRVLLVGKNIDSPITQEHCNKDCIIIERREKGFAVSDFNVLKGKIDFTTRIDIHAHGNKFGSNHIITNAYNSTVLTSNFLEGLSLLANSQPLYIHLWSCFGGAANKDTINLPKGSILVTHAPNNHLSLASLDNFSVLESFSKTRSTDHFSELAEDILTTSMHTSTININKNEH